MDSSPQAKLLRVQWWKDAVNKSYEISTLIKEGNLETNTERIKEIPMHPVLQSIFYLMMNDIKFTKTFFASLFRAHSDLSAPMTIEDLERYGKDSVGSIFNLTLECYWKYQPSITAAQKLELEHAVVHMANAFSIFQLLRATPVHITRRACYLPLQNLSKVILHFTNLISYS